MALRVTFGEVVQAVRAEAKLSTNTSRSIDSLDTIKQKVRRVYTTFCEDFDWQHLQLKRDSAVSRTLLAAGSRYYNWPAAVNPLKIENAWVKWGNVWLPVDYGITYLDRTAFDPDNNQRVDPITNWSFYGGDQFEVWPLPATNGVANGINEMAFEGQKLPEALIADTNRLDMDDVLVYLTVAAEMLAGNGQDKAAQVCGAAAQARFDRLRANLASKTRYSMNHGRIGSSMNHWPRWPRWIR